MAQVQKPPAIKLQIENPPPHQKTRPNIHSLQRACPPLQKTSSIKNHTFATQPSLQNGRLSSYSLTDYNSTNTHDQNLFSIKSSSCSS